MKSVIIMSAYVISTHDAQCIPMQKISQCICILTINTDHFWTEYFFKRFSRWYWPRQSLLNLYWEMIFQLNPFYIYMYDSILWDQKKKIAKYFTSYFFRHASCNPAESKSLQFMKLRDNELLDLLLPPDI